MTLALLVRHGQASFGAANYDVLSERGALQARLLGERWCQLGLRPGVVVTGPLQRQRDTAEQVGEVFRRAGVAWPAPVVCAELTEYPAEELVRALLPGLLSATPALRAEVERSQSADARERLRAFDRLLRATLERWSAGAEGPGESFAAFRARCRAALERLVELAPRGGTLAAFSSGGLIGALVGELLGASGASQLELGFALYNTGVVELKLSGQRRSLSRFNVTSHLLTPELMTHR